MGVCLPSRPQTLYSFGESQDLLDKYAWFHGNSPNISKPGGKKKPNDLGLFDMLGNVWEWTQDEKDESKEVKDMNDRMVRGGGDQRSHRALFQPRPGRADAAFAACRLPRGADLPLRCVRATNTQASGAALARRYENTGGLTPRRSPGNLLH